MVDKVLLIQFVMKCYMWMIFLSRDRLNYVRSITSQSVGWVRFWSDQYLSSRILEIVYDIDRARLEWVGNPRVDKLGNPWGSENPTAIVFFVASESINDAIICFASASSCMLNYFSGVKVDADLPLLLCT